MPADADLALLRQFAEDNDEQAFSQLVRRYAGLVYAACHRILRDRQRAEDATQETFFKLVKRPEMVRRSLSGWLHRSATQHCIDVLRQDNSRRARERRYAAIHDRRAGDPITWQQVSPQVDEALLELPDAMRALLIEHFLNGRTQTELAAAAGVSPATISRRIAKGLDALRVKLRQRDLVIGAAVIGPMLLTHAVEAAPTAVMAGLGKLSLVSGATHAATGSTGLATTGATTGAVASSEAAVSTAVKVAMAIGSMAVIGIAAMVWIDSTRTAGPMLREGPTAAQRITANRPAVSVEMDYVAVEPVDDEMRSDRVVGFQSTASAADGQIAVVFGDGHVETLTIEDAEIRIKAQTDQTLDHFERRGQP